MAGHATDRQVWLIKKLGRELGLPVDGDAVDMNHVLPISTFGRVGHWASLGVIEASQAIERLKREVETYGTVKP